MVPELADYIVFATTSFGIALFASPALENATLSTTLGRVVFFRATILVSTLEVRAIFRVVGGVIALLATALGARAILRIRGISATTTAAARSARHGLQVEYYFITAATTVRSILVGSNSDSLTFTLRRSLALTLAAATNVGSADDVIITSVCIHGVGWLTELISVAIIAVWVKKLQEINVALIAHDAVFLAEKIDASGGARQNLCLCAGREIVQVAVSNFLCPVSGAIGQVTSLQVFTMRSEMQLTLACTGYKPERSQAKVPLLC